MSTSDRQTLSSRSGGPFGTASDRSHSRRRRRSDRSDFSGPEVSVRELTSELKNKSQLNEQLQADYDEALQRLAQAELTIDQLRFGVQTEVSKIVYYTLKETDRRKTSREGSRDPKSHPPFPMATRETANQTTTIEREPSSEDDVTSMSMNTRGQRANMEGKQMALLFQTRSLQDRLDQIQEALQSRGPMSAEMMERLEKIGSDVRKIEEEMANVKENRDRLFETRGVQSAANFDDLNEELGHLKQMLAETQQHVQQQEDGTPEPVHQETPHMERQQPTLQGVMDRLGNLEEQQRVDPTPGTAAEIRQLRQAVEQLHAEVLNQRPAASVTASPQLNNADMPDNSSSTMSSSHYSSSPPPSRSPLTEAAIQTQGVLPSQYLTSSGAKPPVLVTSETQTDRNQSKPSRIPQPTIHQSAEEVSRCVSQSSISTSQSDRVQTDNAPEYNNLRRRRARSPSSSSGERRRYPRRHAHTQDMPSDHSDPYIPLSLPRTQHETQLNPVPSTPRHSAPTQTDETKRLTDTGVQASPHLPQSSRIPRLSLHWKKPGTRLGLADSFDRDSGYIGSAVQPKDKQQTVSSSPNTRSSVSVVPESREQEQPVDDREPVQPTVTHYQPIEMPSVHDRPAFPPPQFPPFQYAGSYPSLQMDPQMSSAMNGLRDELQSLCETLGAARQTQTDKKEEEPKQTLTATAVQTEETLNTSENPTENLVPRLPVEPTNQPLHHPMSSMSVSEEQLRQQFLTGPRGFDQLEGRQRKQRHPKVTREGTKQRRRHRQQADESESQDSESDLPRLLNSHPTQTPASWRVTDLEQFHYKRPVSPSRLHTFVSSVSSSDSEDSESENVVIDSENEEFKCPLCGGTGTFVSPSGERRHRHEKRRKNRSTQTLDSYLGTQRAKITRSEPLKQRRERRDRHISHTLPLYMDEAEEPSPVLRDRPMAARNRQTKKRRSSLDETSSEQHENGRVAVKPRAARALDKEFSDDENEEDYADTPPHVVLKRRPRAQSTPMVYYSDESSSTESPPLVMTERRRRKSPRLVILDEQDETDPVSIYRRRPSRRSSIHVTRQRSPSTTRIVRERPSSVTTRIIRERSPTVTHIVRDKRPSTTHVVRQRPASSTTHIVRDRQPSTTYIIRDRQPSATHMVRERPASTTHVVKERPAFSSHLVLEEEEEEEDTDMEVLYRRSRMRRASPTQRHSSYVIPDGNIVMDNVELALRRVKRETRRASRQSQDMLHNMSADLSSKRIF